MAGNKMPLFRFSCQISTCVFPPFFLAPTFFLNLLRAVFFIMEMKSNILYARAQAAKLRSLGHSVKEIGTFFNKTECWMNKWSKRECFEDKPRSGQASVLTNFVRKSIEKEKEDC